MPNKINTKEHKNRIKVSFYILFIFLILFIFSSLISPQSNNLTKLPSLQSNTEDKLIGLGGIIFMISLFIFFATFEIHSLRKNNLIKKYNFAINLLFFLINVTTFGTGVLLYYFLNFKLETKDSYNFLYIVLSLGFQYLINLLLLKLINKKITWKIVLFESLVHSIIILFTIMLFLLIIYSSWIGLLFVCLIVWSTDILGYEGGSRFGKHKIAPKISPTKSFEGAFCSVFGTIIVTIIVFCIIWFGLKIFPIYPLITTININTLGILIIILSSCIFSLVAIFGDLFYSFIKRRYKVKDFSNIFEKHGGILDRFDAFSFVTIIFAVFIIIGVS